jgi:hypothetical protein
MRRSAILAHHTFYSNGVFAGGIPLYKCGHSLAPGSDSITEGCEVLAAQLEVPGHRFNRRYTIGSMVPHLQPGHPSDKVATERPPLFSGISPEDYTRIAAAGRVKGFARGNVLYSAGQSVQQVILLTSGLATTSQCGPCGTEVILRLSGPATSLARQACLLPAFTLQSARHFGRVGD